MGSQQRLCDKENVREEKKKCIKGCESTSVTLLLPAADERKSLEVDVVLFLL